MDIIETVNTHLASYSVEVFFSQEAFVDLNRYDVQKQQHILALIIKRAKTGPLIKPKGLGEPLRKPLSGFTKIKPKRLALRIVYRPTLVNEKIRMEVIAIGPRDKEKVYLLAAKRLESLADQLENR